MDRAANRRCKRGELPYQLFSVTHVVTPAASRENPSDAACLVSEEEEAHRDFIALTLTTSTGRSQTRMNRLKPDCWVWTPRPPPLCRLLQHSGSLDSALLSHQEEEEEEEEGAAVLCYTTGCGDIISSTGAQWSSSEPPVHSGTSSSSGLCVRCPGATSVQQSKPAVDADEENMSQHFMDARCWEGPGMETQGCVCVYGQREPEGFGPCWPGSPYVYYGVRRNLVVGVEVVEEVAVEEVITEDVYTDDLIDAELLQEEQLYPT
ncbi:uncharacterized protein LOC141801247 [Halichoeres trimaculatus]|uniref:uncharacterized protein LOC141801247 n=1 Tax=Halichoeres trimaculatus TaxID=147232 RepID=UPI003D9F7CE5